MIENSLETIYEEFRKNVDISDRPRVIRVNPYFYHSLSSITDDIFNNRIYGIDIIEDPSVETYEIEY